MYGKAIAGETTLLSFSIYSFTVNATNPRRHKITVSVILVMEMQVLQAVITGLFPIPFVSQHRTNVFILSDNACQQRREESLRGKLHAPIHATHYRIDAGIERKPAEGKKMHSCIT